jgi:hypothetical protein
MGSSSGGEMTFFSEVLIMKLTGTPTEVVFIMTLPFSDKLEPSMDSITDSKTGCPSCYSRLIGRSHKIIKDHFQRSFHSIASTGGI